jgi:hypothetical protein
MACTSYCESSLLDHVLVTCDEYKLGGSPAVIVGQCGSTLVNPEDEEEIAALLLAGQAKLIENVRFSIPAGSPVTVDSPVGCGTSIRINEDRTATLFDANVTGGTNLFWNDLNKKKIAWVLAYLCDSNTTLYINPNQGITVSANFILPEQNNELQRYEVTLSWRDKEIPYQYAAPAGIFN